MTYDHEMLRLKRQRARVTQEALAAVLGISASAVSLFEKGERSLSTRYALTGEDYQRALEQLISERAEAVA